MPHLTDAETTIGQNESVYECGRFKEPDGEWLIIVAQCGAGNHYAQNTVHEAHRDFGSFELQIFVGIAGSLKKDEVPIGSVVAGTKVYNAHSGKALDEGFQARSEYMRAPQALVNFARKIARDGNWQARVIKPDMEGDLLEPNPASPRPPKALVAPIAAVEQVVASARAEIFGNIRRCFSDAHAVEMEGYGAMFAADQQHAQAIVIRGISDCCEDKTAHSDKTNQPIAASHAAAFAFELLAFLTTARPKEEVNFQGLKLEAGVTLQGDVYAPGPPVLGSPTEGEGQVRLVLNFTGKMSEYPQERLDRVVGVLRAVSGDESLVIEKIEEGSVRLFLSAKAKTMSILSSESIRVAIQEQCDATLAGVLPEDLFQQAASYMVEFQNATADLLSWPSSLPDGTQLVRPELEQLVRPIQANDTSTNVLLGNPGSGKSALLALLCRQLFEQGVPTIGIKADFLPPEATSELDLQTHLRISSIPSAAIELISRFGPVVLVIDQLDALASYSDLKTGRLNLLLNLIRRLSGKPNIHIVISARTFEFEHDARLRSIHAEAVSLQLPPWPEIAPHLEATGINPQGWPEDAKEILRSPQTLRTFLALQDHSPTCVFTSYQNLLEYLWNERILKTAHGLEKSKLLMHLAETMAQDETLWLGIARFDEQVDLLDTLVGDGFLTRSQSGGSIGFRHQTIYDHVLARSFLKGEWQLSDYVLSRQASLFIRPKVWATLTFLREVEPQSYEQEFERLWSTPNLRRHLRLLMIEFLGQQQMPTDFEERLLLPVLIRGEERLFGFRAVIGSLGWFDKFERSAIRQAMQEGVPTGSWTVPILQRAIRHRTDAVVALLDESWSSRNEFDALTWLILQESPDWSERALCLGLLVLKRTEIAAYSVSNVATSLAIKDPASALTLIATALHQLLEKVEEEARSLPPLPDDADHVQRITWLINGPKGKFERLLDQSSEWEHLVGIAEASPLQYLKSLWPWYKRLFEDFCDAQTSESGPNSFRHAYGVNLSLTEDDDHYGRPESPLIEGLQTAIELVAKGHPSEFLEWAKENDQADCEPVQRFLAFGMSVNPELYSMEALKFLKSDLRRFTLGGWRDLSGMSKHLIRCVSPYWTAEDVREYGRLVSEYPIQSMEPGSDAKEKRDALRFARKVRLEFLRCLPERHHGEEIKRHIEEEERVFGKGSFQTIKMTGPQWIGSPMSAEEMGKASDDAILNLFNEVPDSTGWDHPKQRMQGGNIQLSRAFGEFAKSDTPRAIRLISKLAPEKHERAAGYALSSISETASPESVTHLLLELHQRGFSSEEFRSSAADAIGHLLHRDVAIDDSLVEILVEWAESSSNNIPDDEEEESGDAGLTLAKEEQPAKVLSVQEKEKEFEREVSGVLWNQFGYSILPGGTYFVLDVLSRILLTRGGTDLDRLIEIYRKQLELGADRKIWKALFRFFDHLHPCDSSKHASLIRDIFKAYPGIDETDEGIRMLAGTHWWAPELLHEVIASWATSSTPRTRQAFGEVVGLVSILQSSKPTTQWAQEATDFLLGHLDQTEARIGIACSAIHLWNEPGKRAACSEILLRLIPDADDRIWRVILDLFRVAGELVPDAPTIAVLSALSERIPSIPEVKSSYVVEGLQSLLPHEPALVGRIALGLLEKWRELLGDVRTSYALSSPQLAEIGITLHRIGGESREVGTAIFEGLIGLEAYGAKEMLDQIDNRFLANPIPSLPRLRRNRPRRKIRSQLISR